MPALPLAERFLATLQARHGPGARIAPGQGAALAALERLGADLAASRRHRARSPGIYLWGPVGRGKTLLMDVFAARLVELGIPCRRSHWHAFCGELQERLAARSGQADPLAKVATALAREFRVLCLDEFHLHDLADGLILGRLLAALTAAGVAVVTTANRPPQTLIEDPILARRLEGPLRPLRERLQPVPVDTRHDYRETACRQPGRYIQCLGPAAEQALADFLGVRPGPPATGWLRERPLGCRHASPELLWTSFADLCRAPRAAADYLHLATAHRRLALTDLPALGPRDADAGRRLIWLIDILYDQGTGLAVSAAVPPEGLFAGLPALADAARTRSRLHEMCAPARALTDAPAVPAITIAASLPL